MTALNNRVLYERAEAGAESRAVTTLDDRLVAIIGELVAGGISLAQATDAFRTKYIAAALRAHEGNSSRAAKNLGVHRNTLLNRLRGRDDIPRRRNRRFGRGRV